MRANSTAIRALARFLTSAPGYKESHFKDEDSLQSIVMADHDRRVAWEMSEAKQILFADADTKLPPPGYTHWTEDQLKRVRFHLIEFVVNYRSVRKHEEVKPTTMKGYILGIQRSFQQYWEYNLKLLEGPVFNCRKDGLMAVIDNRFSEKQANGASVESHNVLSEEDLELLYCSPSLSRDTPQGFQARLVFDTALITAMRPAELVSLTLKQFRKLRVSGESVWKIRSAIGSRIGGSKTNTGGWNAVRDKPTEVTVWNRDALNGKFNVFRDIDDYLSVRLPIECGSDRFFLGINHKANNFSDFFKRQFLGRNSFNRIVSEVCKGEAVQGSGVKNGMTTHGLRGTVTTMLLQSGHADSSEAMRTGHRDMRSLKNYQNLDGELGKQQQTDIFKFKSDCRKREDGEDWRNGVVKKLKLGEEEKENWEAGNINGGGDGREDKEKLSGNGVDPGNVEERRMVANGLRQLSNVNTVNGCSFSFNVHNYFR